MGKQFHDHDHLDRPQLESNGTRISRRKLIASLGTVGLASMAVSAGVYSQSVSESVYGPPDAPDSPNNKRPAVSTTIAALRAESRPLHSDLFYVTDPKREGFFVHDPNDQITADNNGTVLVTASGARLKRIVEGNTVSATWFGAIGDGTHDDTSALQAALNEAVNRSYTIVTIPSGTYKLTQELFLVKNTSVVMEQKTELLRSHGNNIFRNYRTSDVFNGYEGNGNITIENGILNCNALQYPHIASGMAFAHAECVTLRNVTIKDLPSGHAVELTAMKNVTFDRCSFLGFSHDGSKYYSEAIQIETATQAGFIGYSKDHTTTRDVTVQNCYFGNSSTPGMVPWPCGIGAHGSSYNGYYDRILVVNNTFDGSSYWSIRPFKWTNSVITGNVMNNVSGGIFVTMPAPGSESTKDVNGVVQPTQPASSVVIADNIINTASNTGIYVEGQISVNIHKIIVTGNIIHKTGGHAVNIKACNNGIIADNMIEISSKNGFIVADCSNTVFSGNIVRDVTFYGFNVSGSCKMLTIENNKITNASQTGNNVYDGIMLTGTGSDLRIIHNVIRTDLGKARPRYGLNIHRTNEKVVRYGNDLRCDAVSGALSDLSPAPVTSQEDLLS
ncbi:right-handed parallel beta-helix repeat-containing protein [Paenibacillus allorhizosphaerae]|uniref:Pectate lyase superfamily protein domain-containing protein n=1 Tax=Paenibacillus allorhizosphaerae TaxID=2849866 RepID=A0ABM8VIF8_9BACL|nr:right-handed parallel beta-helix repeat-containing protein [Paenibacillus allorhizosphaerae]CAG7643134.1 hypothetical protein PAECIP111802_02959 [Paenibacillus allorhizosphaerae]